MPRILFVVNHAGFFLSHRLPLAIAAREAGFDVHVATPKSKHVQAIRDAGLQWHDLRMQRASRNPINELRAIADLVALYRRLRPALVHHVTPKPVLYGTIAARITGVPAVVNAVSGLGHVYAADEQQGGLLRSAVNASYRLILRHRHMKVIFQNPEHRAQFIQDRWIVPEQAVLVPGSGVDTNVFVPAPPHQGPLMVVIASRLLWTKGVGEFVEAATLLRSEGLDVRFVIVGEPDPDNPASVPLAQLQQWHESGVVEYWGRRTDMADVFSQSDIVCLPSFYSEGLPKVLQEACACALPIVACDIAGCRAVVEDGVNGIMVPPQDGPAVADALRRLVNDPELRHRLGAAGRARAVREFSLDRIVAAHMAIYQQLTEHA